MLIFTVKSLNLLNDDPKLEGGNNLGIIIGSIWVAIAILFLYMVFMQRNSRNSSEKAELVNQTFSLYHLLSNKILYKKK